MHLNLTLSAIKYHLNVIWNILSWIIFIINQFTFVQNTVCKNPFSKSGITKSKFEPRGSEIEMLILMLQECFKLKPSRKVEWQLSKELFSHLRSRCAVDAAAWQQTWAGCWLRATCCCWRTPISYSTSLPSGDRHGRFKYWKRHMKLEDLCW